jgi:hypothetical protein
VRSSSVGVPFCPSEWWKRDCARVLPHDMKVLCWMDERYVCMQKSPLS